MTLEELAAYRDTVWHIHDDAERHAFVSGHILAMRERAISRGLSYPNLDKYETAAIEGARVEMEFVEPKGDVVDEFDAADAELETPR